MNIYDIMKHHPTALTTILGFIRVLEREEERRWNRDRRANEASMAGENYIL